jgi:hypothetical protein
MRLTSRHRTPSRLRAPDGPPERLPRDSRSPEPPELPVGGGPSGESPCQPSPERAASPAAKRVCRRGNAALKDDAKLQTREAAKQAKQTAKQAAKQAATQAKLRAREAAKQAKRWLVSVSVRQRTRLPQDTWHSQRPQTNEQRGEQ